MAIAIVYALSSLIGAGNSTMRLGQSNGSLSQTKTFRPATTYPLPHVSCPTNAAARKSWNNYSFNDRTTYLGNLRYHIAFCMTTGTSSSEVYPNRPNRTASQMGAARIPGAWSVIGVSTFHHWLVMAPLLHTAACLQLFSTPAPNVAETR